MKNTNVINVLMYLFHHGLHERFEHENTKQKLLPQLEEAGFSRHSNYCAFKWLEQLNQQPIKESKVTIPNSIRLYDEEEQIKLNRECRGYLVSLEQYGVLKPHLREKVIAQTLALEEEG